MDLTHSLSFYFYQITSFSMGPMDSAAFAFGRIFRASWQETQRTQMHNARAHYNFYVAAMHAVARDVRCYSEALYNPSCGRSPAIG